MKRVALLVGINEYGNDSGLKSLKFAEADVTLMDALLSEFGFRTVPLVGAEATAARLVETLDALAKEPKDLMAFYFAGHGEEIKGHHRLYLSGARALQETPSCPFIHP